MKTKRRRLCFIGEIGIYERKLACKDGVDGREVHKFETLFQYFFGRLFQSFFRRTRLHEKLFVGRCTLRQMVLK